MTTYTIDIPKTFAIDHSERDLPTGREVKELARTIRYECTAPELREWLSDANYYFDCAGEGWDIGDYGLGLQASARGTAQRVRRLMDAHGVSQDGPIAEANPLRELADELQAEREEEEAAEDERRHNASLRWPS